MRVAPLTFEHDSRAPDAVPCGTAGPARADVGTSIIVSCVQRKRVPVLDELSLRNIGNDVGGRRSARWIERLQSIIESTVPARELYAGEFWSVARRLASASHGRGVAAELWIASAGYGLVRESTPLKPYSATFAAGEDAIAAVDAAAWWADLAGWRLANEAVRSVADLASLRPGGAILVVASPAYLRAMSSDVLAAAELLHNRERLVVLSSSRATRTPLSAHVVSVEAPLRAVLGGSLHALGARVARAILEDLPSGGLTIAFARNVVAALRRTAPVAIAIDRTRATDREVRTFIAAALADAPIGWSKLLKRFRAGGRACEQGRFRALYRAEVENRRADILEALR